MYQLNPSKQLVLFFTVVHLGAGVAFINLSFWLQESLFFFLFVSCCHMNYRYALLKASQSIVGLSQSSCWKLVKKNSRTVTTKKLITCFLTRYFMLLLFKGDNSREYILIARDSLSAEDYRQLYVALAYP